MPRESSQTTLSWTAINGPRFTVSLTFLRLNGLDVTASKEDRVLTFWSLADGSLSEDQLALWFEGNTAPR